MRSFSICAALALAAGTAAADVFQDWNLVVRNNLINTSEVDGSTMVGGSITGTSNYAVQAVTAQSGDGLVVGGNIAAGTNIQINNAGNFRIAGSVDGIANVNGGAQFNDPNAGAMVTSAMNSAANLSAYFAGFSATGTVDGAGNMNSAAHTTIDAQSVAFYSLNQSTINGLGQLNLNFGSADTVVINVDGASSAGTINLTAPPNIIGGFNQANSARIVWNFINTTDLIINNSFNGMILATDAHLDLNGGGINGSVFVDSADLAAEVRLNTYQGAVPAPASLALLGLGIAASARRRRD